MTDGGVCVICADWDTSKYWYVDANGKLCLSGSAPDANNLPNEYLFVFDMDNGQAIEVEEDYKYESEGCGAGTFQLNGNNQWKWKIYEVER